MPFRISAAAIGVQSLAAIIAKPDPSATTWSRLEPLPTSDDTSEALQAKVADPLWMLARQWQFNEFQGEDAGSPVRATVEIEGVPVTSLVAAGVPDVALEGAAPIEALVEREAVLEDCPRLNAQAGQQLIRQLRAAGLGTIVKKVVSDFPARIAAPKDPVADNFGFVWNALLDGKAVDALAIAGEIRPKIGDDNALDAFGTSLGVAGGQPLSDFRAVVTAWLTWLDDLAVSGATPGASPYWKPQRLEYSFGLQADSTQPPLRLDAEEYTDGKLDWHTFTLRGANVQLAPGTPPQLVKPDPLMPTIARYPGMPSDRYWEFEDGRVNFGMLGAAKTDLARIAVIEYALVFGNDWFTLPITLPVNALYKVTKFEVVDNFDVRPVTIPPATNPDGTQWTMYEMSVNTGSRADHLRLTDRLFLCPAVSALEGPPLEHVVMMRDEMANMVWGIEKRVQGTSGEPLDRKFESHRLSTIQQLRPPEGAVVESGAPLNYKLQTPVAPNWIPFLPVRKAGATPFNWSIQLQRGVVSHHYQVTEERLEDPRNADYAAFIERLRDAVFVETEDPAGPEDNLLQKFMFHPRGRILRLNPNAAVEADFLRVEEEEVPRDGIELKRAFNYARDAQGRALLWIGRRKTTGRGEGASGLRFDVIRRGKR